MEERTFVESLIASWPVIALFSGYVFAVLFVFRPGSRAIHDDAASTPFRNDDRPALEPADKEARS
ncbi:cbb3-type cytochrome oxidase subunit 3 [Histidinibacterium lentulum]|uniref:Cbb3-type cytochrome c oxidase subunit 3 n=1 Tax=Histidinibacterium lentulum TaxID=2480588 RepID=A0A3N2QRF9_9RHOB|nr:cbb3-type cytochrome c oxidase subunit 3 [Histidinibacterium lentulum]ROT97770.1 cbb3-type cytochrome c oxidase subunit 3 [Histidinibacterium lentulum]